ncbi:MAG: DUF3859 domain-containing protein [Jannaschia sp.]
MRPRLMLFALGFLLSASGAAAQVRLVEAGIVCPRISSGDLVPAPGTEAGFIRRIEEGTGFDLDARDVPTMDNLSFGFRTALEDGIAEPREVTIVVTHPPMGPRRVTREEWPDTILPDTTNLNLFTFEHEYEKITGPWTFAVEIDGTPVVTIAFEVTEAGGRGEVEAACFRFMS